MYGMAGARIGSRSHNVGGPEPCRRGSIEFAFRVRQKENVLGRQTDLLADLAIAGGCLFLTYASIEKMLEAMMSHLRRWCVQRGAAVPVLNQTSKFPGGCRARAIV